VVERKTDFTVLFSNGVLVGGLELFDEVFVSRGSETFTFITVKEYVVDEEDSINNGSSGTSTVFG
jgi:hypothetical protein